MNLEKYNSEIPYQKKRWKLMYYQKHESEKNVH